MMVKILCFSVDFPWNNLNPVEAICKNVFLGNTGNLLFRDAVIRSVLADDDTVVTFTSLVVKDEDIDYINSEYDYYIIPLADAFRENFVRRLSSCAKGIKKLKIPCIMLGGGARHELGVSFHGCRAFPQDEATKEFCAAVLDKSESIGVRGEITRDYLVTHLGFPPSRVDVIGCPSMQLLAGAKNQITKITPKPLRIATNHRYNAVYQSNEPGLSELGKLLSRIWRKYPDSYFYPQVLREYYFWAFGKPFKGIEVEEYPASLKHPLSTGNRIRLCTNSFSWLNSLREMDFSFGIRMHGTIAGVLAGIPALLVTSDSRSSELAMYHKIPSISIHDMKSDMDIERLYEFAVSGMEEMNRVKKTNFNDYTAFLTRNGIKHPFSNSNDDIPFDRHVAETAFPPPLGSFASAPLTEQELRLSRMHRHLSAKIKMRDEYAEQIKTQLRANRVDDIAIYGSGNYARELTKKLSPEFNVRIYIENDEAESGKTMNDREIVSLKEAVRRDCRNIVVGSKRYKNIIIDRIHMQMDVQKENIRIFSA